MIRRRLMGLTCAGALLMALNACGEKAAPEPKVLNFSILSAESQSSMSPLWDPLIEDLSKEIGTPVKPFFATNYTSLIEAMRFNQVQLGWFSALPALEATRRAQGEVIGRVVDAGGSDSYKSVLIVRKGSGVTLDKVLRCDKSLTFGIGDAKSTSGTLAPMAYLFTPKGIDPASCFKTVRAASHESNIFSVSKGVLDVATNNTVGLLFARRGRPDVADAVEVIWESPPLPESSIVVRQDLDPALKAKITKFFESYGKAKSPDGDRQRKVLEGLTYGGFKPADSNYLDPVRRMEASDNLAAARRSGDAARIAQAQKVLADLAVKAPATAKP